jgi:hypothetical protein
MLAYGENILACRRPGHYSDAVSRRQGWADINETAGVLKSRPGFGAGARHHANRIAVILIVVVMAFLPVANTPDG